MTVGVLLLFLFGGCVAVLTGCAKPDAPPVSISGQQQQWFRIDGYPPVTPQQTDNDLAVCQRETDQALGDKNQMHRMIKTGDPVMDSRSEEALNLQEKLLVKGCMARRGYLWFQQQ